MTRKRVNTSEKRHSDEKGAGVYTPKKRHISKNIEESLNDPTPYDYNSLYKPMGEEKEDGYIEFPDAKPELITEELYDNNQFNEGIEQREFIWLMEDNILYDPIRDEIFADDWDFWLGDCLNDYFDSLDSFDDHEEFIFIENTDLNLQYSVQLSDKPKHEVIPLYIHREQVQSELVERAKKRIREEENDV